MRSAARHGRGEASLLWIAVLSLGVGIFVYALDRPAGAYFLPAWLATDTASGAFGILGAHLPTFVHSFAFVLITAAVLRPWPRLLPAICVAWFVIECAFEIGQWAPLGTRIAAGVPAWFDGLPVLEATGLYFSRGTFDPLDIFSIVLGVIGAYAVARRVYTGGEP